MPTGRYRGDCCRSLLRGSLRALNYLLAIVGVLMVAYALFMYVQWSEAAPPPPAPPSPPHHHHHPPEPAPAPRAQLTVADEVEPQHDTIDYEKLDLWRKDEPDSPPSGGGTGKLAKYPWFIYVFGGAGMFVFLTASVGILSADCAGCGVTCFLGLYHALMVLLLLIQISVVCFYFFDKSWEDELPHDRTGEYKKMRALIVENLRACQFAGLATLGLQLLALLVSCSLYYAESKPRLEYRVLQQLEYDNASQASFPPGAPGASHGARSGRNVPTGAAAARPDGWNRRMQDKYSGGGAAGGGEEGFGYDPEMGRQQARGDDDVGERGAKRNCVIM